MNRRTAAGLALPALLALTIPALAEQQVGPQPPPQKTCLQNNRIYTWRAVSNRELVVGDIQGNVFTVHLSGGCTGLNDSIMAMRFVTKTNLGCLSQGDRVSYREPVLGRMTCFVNEVHPGLEPKKGQRVER
jgi:hypothetical protein